MSYKIRFYKDALKSLKKLDKNTEGRIKDKILLLAKNPTNPELDIKRMQGTDKQFRLRVGSYRVVFSIYENELLIIVIKIGPRGDIYK